MKLKRYSNFLKESLTPIELAQNFAGLRAYMTMELSNVEGYSFYYDTTSGQWGFLNDERDHDIWVDIDFRNHEILAVNAQYEGSPEPIPFKENNSFLTEDNITEDNFEKIANILVDHLRKYLTILQPLKKFRI
jgi:hypothetical protein